MNGMANLRGKHEEILPHATRQYLYQKLQTLPEDEFRKLQNGTLGERVRWACQTIREIDPEASVEVIARAAGITRQSIWNVIKGKTKRPSADILLAISRIVGLPLSFFLMGVFPLRQVDSHLPADLVRFALNPANEDFVVPALKLAQSCSERGLSPKAIEQMNELLLAICEDKH